MKRLHVSFNVEDLDKSVAFYSTLFQATPTVLKDDYAKWMLDDPRVNFVLEGGGGSPGFGHAGIQAEDETELDAVFESMKSAEAPYLSEGVTNCCYAKSEKSWTADPDGVMWEAFYTFHQSDERGSPNLTADEVVELTNDPQATGGCAGGGCC
ncbi:MAG: glyoxalase/bleomycin resistance/dioxygenase family protein [Pseudomonadales bacterium]|nr:glyoxalase/bleomycin resistance/dioxygenase family protein [Pseudomonadales bacterium]